VESSEVAEILEEKVETSEGREETVVDLEEIEAGMAATVESGEVIVVLVDMREEMAASMVEVTGEATDMAESGEERANTATGAETVGSGGAMANGEAIEAGTMRSMVKDILAAESADGTMTAVGTLATNTDGVETMVAGMTAATAATGAGGEETTVAGIMSADMAINGAGMNTVMDGATMAIDPMDGVEDAIGGALTGSHTEIRGIMGIILSRGSRVRTGLTRQSLVLSPPRQDGGISIKGGLRQVLRLSLRGPRLSSTIRDDMTIFRRGKVCHQSFSRCQSKDQPHLLRQRQTVSMCRSRISPSFQRLRSTRISSLNRHVTPLLLSTMTINRRPLLLITALWRQSMN